MNLRNLDVPTLRAALWTWRALYRVRRELVERGLDYEAPPPPPQLPRHARRGVLGVLRRTDNTCLERALVLQQWSASHGDPRDVIVAVRGPSVDFAAHAWVEGDGDAEEETFSELMRLEPR